MTQIFLRSRKCAKEEERLYPCPWKEEWSHLSISGHQNGSSESFPYPRPSLASSAPGPGPWHGQKYIPCRGKLLPLDGKRPLMLRDNLGNMSASRGGIWKLFYFLGAFPSSFQDAYQLSHELASSRLWLPDQRGPYRDSATESG